MKTGALTAAIALLMSVPATMQAQEEKKTGEVKIKTSAVCDMCKNKIEKALKFEKGVKSASLDLETREVTVTFKPGKTTAEQLRKAISMAGYDADDVKADPKAFEKLDKCCKPGGMEGIRN